MSLPANETDPVHWSTSQVLDWMTNFADSKEGIKLKILNIVQENDLDGHALKQLRDDQEEMHDLLPVLKERLTFKAMMKQLLGPNNPHSQASPSNRHLTNQTTRISAAPQSPTQTPSTSLDSPPPPPIRQQIPALTPVYTSNKGMLSNLQSGAVLPAFSSFVSSQGLPSNSQSVPMSESVTTAAHVTENDGPRIGQGDMYRGVYPTGIISDNSSQRIPTTQTPIYCSQIQVSSPEMIPVSNFDYQYAYNDSRTASTTTAGSQKHTYTSPYASDQRVASGRNSNFRHRLGTLNASRGARLSKAHDITQKYKKILQRVKATPSQSEHEQIQFPAPLPTFSPILKQQIDRGNILSFKTRFVYECAQFYMSINPTPTHTAYRNISMTIVAKFPDLADSSNEKEPWRPFNNSLSQAIRNIRRRLRSVPGTGFPPAAPRYHHAPVRAMSANTKMQTTNEDSTVTSRIVTTHHDTGESTNQISEPVLVSDEDPLECVDVPEEVSIAVKDDTGASAEDEIVIKTEEAMAEENIIPTEWTNEET